MKLTLGFSTCPNDTYIFDAAVNGKINTHGIEFDVILADVEELNKLAFKGEIDVTKLSINAFFHVRNNYDLLNSGSALGFRNGPLLISKRKISKDELRNLKIGIPGKYTTANLLLNIAFPEAKNKKEYLFSDIENALLSGEIDAGLIIHESRFTYENKGLKKIIDLGEFWDNSCSLPLPLGGIAINKKYGKDTAQKIDNIIKESIEYANLNPDSAIKYMKKHAQEIDDNVMKKHIELYVNEQTVEMNELGKKAIKYLFEKAEAVNALI